METGARPERDRRSPDPSRDPDLPGLATEPLSHKPGATRLLAIIPPARHSWCRARQPSLGKERGPAYSPRLGSYSRTLRFGCCIPQETRLGAFPHNGCGSKRSSLSRPVLPNGRILRRYARKRARAATTATRQAHRRARSEQRYSTNRTRRRREARRTCRAPSSKNRAGSEFWQPSSVRAGRRALPLRCLALAALPT